MKFNIFWHPHMLEAGIDMSGDNVLGNQRYVAIIIGTQDAINAQMRSIGSEKIHMRNISSKKIRGRIFHELDFSGQDMIAICVRIEQKLIVDEMLKARRSRKYKNAESRIRKQLYKYVWYSIKDCIMDFLIRHGKTLDDVSFQCDQDGRSFLRDVSLKHAGAKKAHSLSDIVVWFNMHDKEPKGVIVKDMYGRTLRQLKIEFK